METISLKLESEFLQDVEKAMKKHRYTTKTEFIREAMRKHLLDLEKEEALQRLEKIYGASKRKTTDAQLKKAREEAVKDIAKEIGVDLD